jgi:hypothetical protein
MMDIRSQFNDLIRTDLADVGVSATCECKCDRNPQRHANQPCTNEATHYVALHRWGWCDETVDDVEKLDPDGNLTALMCAACANNAWNVAAGNIRKLLMSLPPGQRPHCPTCGRPTHLTADIIEKRPL